MKCISDFTLGFLLLPILSIPMVIIALLLKLTSRGPVLYWSDRIGKNNVIFKMPKFRTMRVNTPEVATHLLTNPDQYLTPFGRILRKSCFDEFPQLYSILKGDMSFVGPRPALFNQDDLVELRTKKRVHTLTPGITGWAQVNARDELSISEKVAFDEYYLYNRTLLFDIRIILMTFVKVLHSEGGKRQ